MLIPLAELAIGMVIGRDLHTKDNVLLVSKGFTINDTVLRRLHNFHRQNQIDDHIPILSGL